MSPAKVLRIHTSLKLIPYSLPIHILSVLQMYEQYIIKIFLLAGSTSHQSN